MSGKTPIELVESADYFITVLRLGRIIAREAGVNEAEMRVRFGITGSAARKPNFQVEWVRNDRIVRAWPFYGTGKRNLRIRRYAGTNISKPYTFEALEAMKVERLGFAA